MEIDGETGKVTIERYSAIDDCGNVINPMIVEGQVHGGIAQSIAQALYEETVYDESGQILTGSLVDYMIPRRPSSRASTRVARSRRRRATRWG